MVALLGLAALLTWTSEAFAVRSVITSVYDEFYRYAEETPIDVLIAGSSHSQCDINTLLLSNSLGTTAYTLAMPAQTIGLTRYALEDALMSARPRIVLIDTFLLAYPDILPGREAFIYEQLDAFRSKKVKLASIADLFPETHYFEAAFPIISNHEAWKDPVLMHRNQLYRYGGASLDKNRHYNGFTPQASSMTPATFRQTETVNFETLPPIPEESWEYVRQIIALCRQAGAEPVFVQLPLLETYSRRVGYEGRARDLAEGLRQLDAVFLDYNSPTVLSELALTPEDFLDEYSSIGNNHLNIQGANKLTVLLSDALLSRYPEISNTAAAPAPHTPPQMLRFFASLKPEDLVFLSIRDDASDGWTEDELKWLEAVGLKQLPAGYWGQSYAAVFTGGTVLFEFRSPERIDVAFEQGRLLGGVPLPADARLISAGSASGPAECHIFLNGTDYAFNYRGLNFVVMSRNSGEVHRVEQFDLYDRSLYLADLLEALK